MWAFFIYSYNILLLYCSRETKRLRLKTSKQILRLVFLLRFGVRNYSLGKVLVFSSGLCWAYHSIGCHNFWAAIPSPVGCVTFLKSRCNAGQQWGCPASSEILESFWWRTTRRNLIEHSWRPVQHTVDGLTHLRHASYCTLFALEGHGCHVISSVLAKMVTAQHNSFFWHYHITKVSSADDSPVLVQWNKV